uniref:CaiB/BaiF CoA transferase family protein n=1 Tax=Castellaniella defragrans TaxID=75697 RepID=UPI003341C3CA
MNTTGALQGIRVIDLSRVLGGPFAAQVLADHGADVIKIEPPAGDDTRLWGPPFRQGSAAYFSGINRNKRGMVIDFSTVQGQALLRRLLESADVLIENFKIGTLEKWGLDALTEQFPRLVHCRISGFGADGPLGGLPGYDSVIQAMAGLMSVNGNADGAPLRVGLPVVDMVTGMNAAMGVLLALQARNRSNRGQFVEAALYDSGVSLLHPHIPNYLWSGKVPQRTGNAHPNITPYDAYQSATGPIYIAVGNNRQFSRMCEFLGLDALPSDARFADNASRCAHRQALKDILEQALAQQDGRALVDQMIRLGIPCGPIQDVADVVKHPHTRHRQMVISIGDYQGIASPIKLGDTPASYRLAPPRHGEHSRSILREYGLDEQGIQALIDSQTIREAQEA